MRFAARHKAPPASRLMAGIGGAVPGREGVKWGPIGPVLGSARATGRATKDTLMHKLMLSALVSVTLGLGTGFAGSAKAATQDEINATLGADQSIWSGLFTLAVADQIRTHCDSIEARTFTVTRFVYGLYSQAREYGYSRDEIRAFQRADSTEARLRAEVGAYFAQNGVREGAPETYCALGQSEIAAGSAAGELLRAR